MRSEADGATDVLSSLPIIACCIFAVMVLVAAIGQTAVSRYDGDGEAAMEESCRGLLAEAAKTLTERSEDGRRYLDKDWRERAAGMSPPESSPEGVSTAITVRLLGEEPSEFPLSGNISVCREIFSASAPILLVSEGTCIPGEIIARAGR